MSLLSKIFGKTTDRQAASENPDEDWVLAERNSESGISLIRIRRLPSVFSFASSKFRVSISWHYQEQPKVGAPNATEVERMERFELLIRQHIEVAGAALLTIIFTEARFKQYEFYTDDVKRFIKLLNKMPAKDGSFPIEIREEKDEAGEFYRSYAQGILV